jgi:proline dehydrogenase
LFARVLLGIADHPRVRSFAASSRVCRSVFDRFVAGEDVEAAVAAVAQLDAVGLRATVGVLGEDVTDAYQASETVRAYRALVDALAEHGLAHGNETSVKLSEPLRDSWRLQTLRALDRAWRADPG